MSEAIGDVIFYTLSAKIIWKTFSLPDPGGVWNTPYKWIQKNSFSIFFFTAPITYTHDNYLLLVENQQYILISR